MAKSKKKPIFWLKGNYRQVNQMWQKIVHKMDDPNVQVMYCGYNPDSRKSSLLRFATASDIILALKNRDIFDARPRIIKMLGLPEDYSLITDYLSRANNDNILVVCGKPGYRARPPSTRWIPAQNSKFYKEFKSNGHILDFPETADSNAEAVEWIQEIMAEEGASIKKEAAERLVALKGKNLDILTSESIRLSVYKPTEKIDRKDVDASCFYTFLDTVWEFLDALDAQDSSAALQYLQKFYSVAGQHLGESFSGELVKLFGAVTQHFLFILLLKNSPGAMASSTSANSAVSGLKKIKPSEVYKLSKGIISAEELPDLFSSGFVYMNFRKKGVKNALRWKLGKIYDVFRDLMRCMFLCRKHYSQVYQQLCLNTFVLVVCGKLTSKQAAHVRGDRSHV